MWQYRAFELNESSQTLDPSTHPTPERVGCENSGKVREELRHRRPTQFQQKDVVSKGLGGSLRQECSCVGSVKGALADLGTNKTDLACIFGLMSWTFLGFA